MGARELKHQAKLTEWAEKVRACRSSGQTVAGWCREQGISSKTYYNWEREVLWLAEKERGGGVQESGIVALRVVNESEEKIGTAARIHVGEVTIEIEKGADAGTIRAIIEGIRGC